MCPTCLPGCSCPKGALRKTIRHPHQGASDESRLRWGAGKGPTQLFRPGQQWRGRHWAQSPRESGKARRPPQFSGTRKLQDPLPPAGQSCLLSRMGPAHRPTDPRSRSPRPPTRDRGCRPRGWGQPRPPFPEPVSCRDPRCSPRGNPACRGTFGGRRKAVRATFSQHHLSGFGIAQLEFYHLH